MISVLRRLPLNFHFPVLKSTSIPPSSSPPSFSFLLFSPLMDSSTTSQRLAALAQQLRLYKPPPPPVDDDDDDGSKDVDDRSNKIVTQLGFAESSTPIGQTLQEEEREAESEKMNKKQGFTPKKAAVLVCLFEGDQGELRVILTKRSSKLSTHSGEVALPGGKMEEGDKDEADTATREAQEEIGLDPALVNVVTVLEPFLSKHLLRVVPVIGILSRKEAFKPLPNSEEVDAIFDAPLEMFLKDVNHRVEEREWMGHRYLVHFFNYESGNDKFLIWGLTAGILIRAASVVYQRPPPFTEQNPGLKIPQSANENTVMR